MIAFFKPKFHDVPQPGVITATSLTFMGESPPPSPKSRRAARLASHESPRAARGKNSLGQAQPTRGRATSLRCWGRAVAVWPRNAAPS
jgi:hypothetical protein